MWASCAGEMARRALVWSVKHGRVPEVANISNCKYARVKSGPFFGKDAGLSEICNLDETLKWSMAFYSCRIPTLRWNFCFSTQQMDFLLVLKQHLLLQWHLSRNKTNLLIFHPPGVLTLDRHPCGFPATPLTASVL